MKKKVQIRSMCALCVLVLLVVLGGTAFGAEKQDAAVIRVGYTDKGQMIKKSGGRFTGYGVDYLNRLAAYTGWQYEYVLVTEENRLEELAEGRVQLLCDVSADEAVLEDILLSEEISSISYSILCAKKDDTSVFFNEYEAIDKKRIAMNTSRKMEPMLEEFAQDHKLSYTPVYCSSYEKMEKALEENRADLMLISNQRDSSSYKYVAKTGLRNQYFAVSAGNPKLMEAIDYADRQMKLNQPFIIASLYETYYGRPSQVLTGMTREEYEFIKNQTPVRIVCDTGSFPVAYLDEETGEYRGVYADALALVRKESGLNFQIISVDEYKDAWKLLKNGKADMSEGMYLNEELKKEYGLTASRPHITASYAMISRAGEALEGKLTIAMPENYVGVHTYIKEKYPDWEILPLKNTKECLKKTASGEADGTLVNAVLLQTVYNLNNYPELAIFPMYRVDVPISYGFAGPNAALLCQIVDKAINRIPKEAMENCTLENAVTTTYEPSFRDLVRKLLPVVAVLFLIFLVLYLLTLWGRERKYRYLAMTDALTGLWNGRCFRQKAGEALIDNPQKEYQLISLDMEHFKYVNNDLGEKTADIILLEIAGRLRSVCGEDGLCARDMADVFLLLLEAGENIEERLRELSREISFEQNGITQRYKPDIKFGICRIQKGEKRLPVNEYIDRSMEARKSIKKNPFQHLAYFDQKMEERISSEARIEKKMESSLEKGEFVVYYQPKYSLDSNRIEGAEALVRWNSPEDGFLYPGAFIPVFERNGFVVRLDFFVYEEVLKTLAKWRKKGRRDLTVSVNVSRAHIKSSDFLQKLTALADTYQVPRRNLELELTETVLGGNRNDVLVFIRACKESGFQISIDDFGSGYSSLNLLKDLPVDVLKIDREFLNETEASERSRIIIKEIVEMASRIQIRTLCEGVETPEQAGFLKKIGCELAQGYLYSRPVALEVFEGLMDQEQG